MSAMVCKHGIVVGKISRHYHGPWLNAVSALVLDITTNILFLHIVI